MALTAEQQAQLEALQAEASKPPHRTREGVAGVLHALIETVAGVVAHRSPEDWAQMAETVEQELGTPPKDDDAGDASKGS